MDDASFSQDPNAMMGADPMADPNAAAGADPTMADPNAAAGGDPTMTDPNAAAGGDPTMADPTMGDPNADMGGGDDPLVQAITQRAGDLSDKDKKTLLSYEDSLKADDAENGGGEDMAQQQQPMMEQVIFTKKQLNKLQENFGPSQDELMKKPNRKALPEKKRKSNGSPFSSPFA